MQASLASVRPKRARCGWAGKRSFDVSLAAALIALLALPAGLIALVLLLGQGAPLLFVQKRVGLNGVPFRLHKFRTMREAYDEAGRPLPDAERTAVLGRFLRRTRLDELPQLMHILRGDMSFVGPRPLLPATGGDASWQRGRQTVRPGLTGWAQVSGNTLLSAAEKHALDIWYVDHQSLRLDLFILLATLRTAIQGERVHRRRLECAQRHLAGRALDAPGA